jgi:hypothetical protein
MTTQLIKQLKEILIDDDTAFIKINNSQWKNHYIEYDGEIEYEENELGICTSFSDDGEFDTIKEETIKYYLDNEDKFYNLLISSLKTFFLNKVGDNQYQYKAYKCDNNFNTYETYEEAIPKIITDDWIQKNIKLININILNEYNNYSTLEFDFAVGWDDEHGLRALVWQDKVIQFAEGGYCWCDTEAYLNESFKY